MNVPILSDTELIQHHQKTVESYQQKYLAFFSSVLGGITRNPRWMNIPIDDHMVHRGDGVFEALRVINGKIYLLREHLARLRLSAEKIFINHKHFGQIEDLVRQTVDAAMIKENSAGAWIRLFLSRGPGGMSANPYEPQHPELYILVTRFHPPQEKLYRDGVSIKKSKIPVKDPFFANLKSCNYLPNVLMKKESMDRAVDFCIGVDPEGAITESSTENIAWLDKKSRLCHPPLDFILKGTTMTRLFDLVEKKKLFPTARNEKVSFEELKNSCQVFIIGTSWDLLPVKSIEDENGKIHKEISKDSARLLHVLREDQSGF